MAAVRRVLALGGHDFTSRPPDRAICELLLRLADRPVGRARGEVVAAEGKDAADLHQAATAVESASGTGAVGTAPRSPRKVVAIRISTTRCPATSSR